MVNGTSNTYTYYDLVTVTNFRLAKVTKWRNYTKIIQLWLANFAIIRVYFYKSNLDFLESVKKKNVDDADSAYIS